MGQRSNAPHRFTLRDLADSLGVSKTTVSNAFSQLGRQAGRDLLERATPPTAVLAMSDRLALGVLAAAREMRVDVLRSLAVVGFDDIAAAAMSRPSLTTIRQLLRLKGYAAARFLLDAPRPAPGTRPRKRSGSAATRWSSPSNW